MPNAETELRLPVYTIGHSTRTISEFVDLMRVGSVEIAVDVRSIPRSRTNPLYNLDRLPVELGHFQIGHVYMPKLGGLRGHTASVATEVNSLWRNKSFHYYADYALTPDFQEGLKELLKLSSERRCAIMCAEAVWWRCHRRIIADYLIHHGRDVFHLMAPDRAEPAAMTKGAMAAGDFITYPASAQSLLAVGRTLEDPGV